MIKISKRVQLTIDEGQKRGFHFEILNLKKELVKVSKDNWTFTFSAIPGTLNLISNGNHKGWDDKVIEKKEMEKIGMRVPKTIGIIKKLKELDKIKLTFPLVVKPTKGSLSKNVFTNLKSKEELEETIKTIEKTKKTILIEEHVQGSHYRILIINNKYISCVERRSANVTGDGKHTIKELIDIRNQESERGEPTDLSKTVHYLVFNKTSEDILKSKNLSIKSILSKNKILKIQHKINAALGADYIDFTNQLNKSIINQCLKFTKKNNLFVIGFDLVTTDISKPLEKTKGAFNEFNLKPFIDLNGNNNIGSKHNPAPEIWNKIEKIKPKGNF